jgi:hypothetical protein
MRGKAEANCCGSETRIARRPLHPFGKCFCERGPRFAGTWTYAHASTPVLWTSDSSRKTIHSWESECTCVLKDLFPGSRRCEPDRPQHHCPVTP